MNRYCSTLSNPFTFMGQQGLFPTISSFKTGKNYSEKVNSLCTFLFSAINVDLSYSITGKGCFYTDQFSFYTDQFSFYTDHSSIITDQYSSLTDQFYSLTDKDGFYTDQFISNTDH